MNVVNTRTNILIFMVVTQEPTIENASCYSCLPHILETFIIKKTSSIKDKVQMPKVLQIHAWLHEDMQHLELGGDVRTQKCPFFIHFISRYSSHFIAPLTFYHTISIHICGFYIIIFHFIHFSIISEFMIKYYKIQMFFIYISQLCVSFVMCRNM